MRKRKGKGIGEEVSLNVRCSKSIMVRKREGEEGAIGLEMVN